MKTLILIFTALLLTAPAQAAEVTQAYRVTFKSLWTAKDHKSAPGNAHFSPIVAVAHNSNYDLLPLGSFVTPGLERVAELGDTSIIDDEIAVAIQNKAVSSTASTKNLFIKDATVQTFDVVISNKTPFLSFVTMIAPSPDWVVGLSNLKLHNDADGFFPGITTPLPLYAINAGTEKGDFGGNFSINNSANTPHDPINPLTGMYFDKPFAEITIEPIN